MILEYFNPNTSKIDSLNLLLPKSIFLGLTFNSTYTVDSDGVVLSERPEIKEYKENDDLIYYLKLENLFGKDYVSFNMNSKQLKQRYLEGLTYENILKLLDDFRNIFGYTYLKSTVNLLTEAIINDVDLCVESHINNYDLVAEFLAEKKRTTHSHARVYRSSNTFDEVSKLTGFQIGMRKSYEHFLKFYSKQHEMSQDFINAYGVNISDIGFRLEITLKKSVDFKQHFKSLIIKPIEIFEVIRNRLEITRLIEKNRIERIDLKIKDLSINSSILLFFFITEMKKGSSFEEIFTRLPLDSFPVVSRSRKRAEIREHLLDFYKQKGVKLAYLKKDFWID